LTQEERRALAEVQKQRAGVERQHRHALTGLADKGLCRRTDAGWRILSDLFDAYVAGVEGQANGKIWLDESTDELYQGQTLLADLSPLERSVLHFLTSHPRVRHAKTDLIVGTWPDELRRQGVTDDSLYQVIRELRKRIEPNPAKPCYIVTWRGRPEGGYQFFPEGRPG
jgi:DNA-binding response OmpR family regulator